MLSGETKTEFVVDASGRFATGIFGRGSLAKVMQVIRLTPKPVFKLLRL
jgi:hypothetical protein